MNEEIFRKYDIRGIAARDLTDDVVSAIGRAFVSYHLEQGGSLSGFRVGIGRDARGSSPRLFDALAAGLKSAGADVVDLGLVPTPLVYFAMFEGRGLGGAIQITGSHNAAEYNGMKMMMGERTLYGDAILRLRDLARAPEPDATVSPGALSLDTQLRERYLDWLRRDISAGPRRLKVVLDSGNGVAGVVAPEAVRRLFDAQVIELFSEPDERFPHHHPDPTVLENLTHLIEAVREHGADLGIAYDGDGDRIGVVDERGEVIWGDRLMIILARQVLEAHPGATILGEVKCSETLYEEIARAGGAPVMSAVGHSLIKAKIKETGALLAGEMSGHIFYNDRYFGFDDAVYATCRVLEIASRTQGSFSELLEDVRPMFATPELRVDCDESIKFEVPGLVAAQAKAFEVTTIDGARIAFEGGWALVRASNTGPVLVTRVEAESPELRDAWLERLNAWVSGAIASLS